MIVTAETYHVPVLLRESIDGLAIQSGGIYLDMTFGGGGHSSEILRRLGPEGRLYGFDQDSDAEKNIPADDRFTFVYSNFRYVKQWMRYYGIDHVDGAIADLGVSSHHFDDAARGFSYRFEDAPLDMRMNKHSRLTAADIVNSYSEEQLADIFYLYGEMKQSRRLAALIVKARSSQRIATTGQLLAALGCNVTAGAPLRAADAPAGYTPTSGSGGAWKKDMARLFQALRIEVNHEMEALKEMLHGVTQVLAPGGRLVVITYHSLEDRMVKNMMKAGNTEGRVRQDFFGHVQAPLKPVGSKVLTASNEEQQRNPRSRSAKLRIAEKI